MIGLTAAVLIKKQKITIKRKNVKEY